MSYSNGSSFSPERLVEINGLNLVRFTLFEVNFVCKKYNLCAICRNGKLVRFEMED